MSMCIRIWAFGSMHLEISDLNVSKKNKDLGILCTIPHIDVRAYHEYVLTHVKQNTGDLELLHNPPSLETFLGF